MNVAVKYYFRMSSLLKDSFFMEYVYVLEYLKLFSDLNVSTNKLCKDKEFR